METYRAYLMGKKRDWNRKLLSTGKRPARRVLRGLIHYRAIVAEYLEAKRDVIRAEGISDG